MARLNGYLNKIGAVDSEDYGHCGQKEIVAHFSFQCSEWQRDREQIRSISEGR